MQVLFLKTHKKFKTSDIADVKEGYFTNFLAPNKIAIKATKISKELAKKLQDKKEKDDSTLKENYTNIVNTLKEKTITLSKKADQDSLYASIREDDIAQEIKQAFNIDIEPRFVNIPSPIKSTGKHAITISFDQDIKLSLNVEVKALEEEAIENLEKELAEEPKIEAAKSETKEETSVTKDINDEEEAASTSQKEENTPETQEEETKSDASEEAQESLETSELKTAQSEQSDT